MYIDPNHCDTPVENILEISQMLLNLLNDNDYKPGSVFSEEFLATLIMDRSMTNEYLNGEGVIVN